MNKVHTKINIRKRGVHSSDVSCVFRELEEETNTYLFLTCNITKKKSGTCVIVEWK